LNRSWEAESVLPTEGRGTIARYKFCVRRIMCYQMKTSLKGMCASSALTALMEFKMKLYIHPVAVFSRPLTLFVAESGIDVEMISVEVFEGRCKEETFAKI